MLWQRLAIWLIWTTAVASAARCRTDERLEGGGCISCPDCQGGGMFKNETATRLISKDGDYLSCYPCVQCPKGFYRLQNSYSKTCSPCKLDCGNLNRYASQSCGGGASGHCGDCKDGFEATLNVANSFCQPKHKDVKKELPNNQEGVQNANEDGSKQEDAFKGWEIVLLITFPLFAVGSVCLVVMKVLKSFSRCIITTGFYHAGSRTIQNRNNQIPEKEPLANTGPVSDKEHDSPASGKELLASERSGNENESWTYKQLNPEREPLTNNDPVQGKEEDEQLQDVIVIPATPREPTTVKYVVPDYPAHSFASEEEEEFRRECFIIISTSISGKTVRSFFHGLGLENQHIDPEEELWVKNPEAHTYKDYIYNVLKRWHQLNYKRTDLRILCNALADNGFTDVANKLADYHLRYATGNQSLPG